MKQHEVLRKYIAGLVKGLANSLIVVSPAGFGKTETTMATLKEMGLADGRHYRYVSNYITPVELFLLLDEINHLQEPKLLILDDIEDTLANRKAIGLLKSALWEVSGRRQVGWHSGTYRVKEKEFDFRGRIIFLLNYLNKKSAIVNALKDRGLYYEMGLTIEEMFELMKEKAKMPYQDIPYNTREEIVRFLSKVGNKSPNITLRLLPKAYNIYLISPNHYQELILGLLKE